MANVLFSSAYGARQTTLAWVALETTGSAVAVGWVVAAQLLPFIVLGLSAGVVVDRRSRRRTILAVEVATTLVTLAFGLVTLAGLEVWQIFAFAAGLGVISLLDNPVRGAMVWEVVGTRHMANAVRVNGITYQTGQILGPMAAGFLIAAVGPGATLLLVAVVGTAEFLTMRAIRVRETVVRQTALRASVPRRRGELRELAAYVRRKPRIVTVLLLVGVVSTLITTMPVLLSSYSSEVFGTGSSGFGVFTAVVAVGALCGALLSVVAPFPTVVSAIATATALAAVQATTAWLPTPVAFAAGLAVLGTLLMLTDIGNLSIVQVSSPARIKGRILALQSVLYLGGQGLGGLLVGVAVSALGPRVSMSASGVATLLLVLAIALVAGRRARATAPAHRPRPSAPRSVTP